jgi:hypothetical protein
MNPNRKTLLAVAFCVVLRAQAPPPAVLQIEVENLVQYQEDNQDPAKYATDPNLAAAVVPRNFNAAVAIGDIVSVNGQPCKGTLIRNIRTSTLSAAPTPGQAIADMVRTAAVSDSFEILKTDGTPVGTIVAYGLAGGTPFPGASPSQSDANFAIVGGTGAFLGARGQFGRTTTPQTTSQRQASITEDPANRRRNGGGRVFFLVQLIPQSSPQIVSLTHADFSPVTAAKPAKAGEVLILKAGGLGPTVPFANPGQPFPADAPAAVNSPLSVTVNGQPAEVVNGFGWPGLVDTFRVDFRVPADAASGTASLQVSAAWIAGPPLSIAIQ